MNKGEQTRYFLSKRRLSVCTGAVISCLCYIKHGLQKQRENHEKSLDIHIWSPILNYLRPHTVVIRKHRLINAWIEFSTQRNKLYIFNVSPLDFIPNKQLKYEGIWTNFLSSQYLLKIFIYQLFTWILFATEENRMKILWMNLLFVISNVMLL